MPYIIQQSVLHSHNLLHLDNPNPDESEKISKPIQIQKNPKILPDRTPKSGSCTPLAHLSASRTKNEATEAWKALRRVLTSGAEVYGV